MLQNVTIERRDYKWVITTTVESEEEVLVTRDSVVAVKVVDRQVELGAVVIGDYRSLLNAAARQMNFWRVENAYTEGAQGVA